MATRSPTKLTLDKAMHHPASPGGKSPVKKAKHWDSQPEGEGSTENPCNSTQLRTELLNKVLELLDQDDSVVDFVASLVDTVSTLPLQDANMRRAFLAQLQNMPKPGRTSGRTQCLNPQSCRAFILACANEIVDLDENDPSFDYAETCVDSDEFKDVAIRPVSPLQSRVHIHIPTADYAETLSSRTSVPEPPAAADVTAQFRRVLRQHFDYASTVHSSMCSSECERDGCLQVAFSKLHQHAQELARKRQIFDEFKRQMPMEVPSPPKKPSPRPETAVASNRSMQDLATKYQTFEALKSNRSMSPTNLSRKKRAFYKFKTTEQPRRSKATTASPHHIQVQSQQPRPTNSAMSAFVKDCAMSALLVVLACIAYDELKLW
ncbi:hypothetical protein H310_00536 [Aphanomyces invadans]|uniref:Uncharacterized protein n=1 Tax=Aphanomyces invadans TaxID=157072 RepID=A0A024UUG5_9STRA|nr:hypothetical protein H310_00536 [Aphanomyces invadans]ETW10166.1 hypothetical protein H310_00536 [Aphanomyces invadans]|eukprot:XP_008861577.1 hypothetical protein H310_00536 [Aphanomyces invadans]